LLLIISVFSPLRIFSRVYSLFQLLNMWNLPGSTLPLPWLTQGMLIFEVKYTSGGELG